MADNVKFQRQRLSTPPVDTVVAADEIDNTLYQRVNIFGKTGDTTFQSPRIDAATPAIETIDYEHYEIHAGNSYDIIDVVDLAGSGVRDIQITTPNNTEWMHFFFNISVESETEWYLYENVAIASAGAAIVANNLNRNSINESGVTIAFIDNTSVANANADTTVSGATEIYHGITGAGKDAGQLDHKHEVILKQNEDYCVRFIANTAGYVNYHLNWYEYTSKTA